MDNSKHLLFLNWFVFTYIQFLLFKKARHCITFCWDFSSTASSKDCWMVAATDESKIQSVLTVNKGNFIWRNYAVKVM